jgi:chromosomal replication initiation ATPase DnaA
MNQTYKLKLNNAKSDGERIRLIIKDLAIHRISGRFVLKQDQFEHVGQIFENWKNEISKPVPENEGLETILQAVKEVTGIDLKTNMSQKTEVVNARFIYCSIASSQGYKLSEIGAKINRNHTAVINALAKTIEYYRQDVEFKELYQKIIMRFHKMLKTQKV